MLTHKQMQIAIENFLIDRFGLILGHHITHAPAFLCVCVLCVCVVNDGEHHI